MSKTKQEAADYLDVSVRTVESYAAQNKLSVTYARGKRGQVAMFDDEELQRLKAELSEPIYPQRPTVAGSPEKLTTRPNGQSNALAQVDTFAVLDRLAEMLKAQKEHEYSKVKLSEKLTLDLSEAAQLSGLSEWRLRTDAKAGKLKSITGGRGYRVRRADLDAYVAGL
jgi:hypothetical protein